MIDLNEVSTSEEEEEFENMTYLPDLEKAQRQIKELEADLKAAKDVISAQEIRIRRYERKFETTFDVLNEALKDFDAARNKVRGLMDQPGYY